MEQQADARAFRALRDQRASDNTQKRAWLLETSALSEDRNNGIFGPTSVNPQYIVSDGEGPLDTRQALDLKSSDDSADPDSSESESRQQVNLGWFRLNFDCASVTAQRTSHCSTRDSARV